MNLRLVTACSTILLAISSASMAQTSVAEFKSLSWNTNHVGTLMDLSSYRETFRDDFNEQNIVPDGEKGRWYAPIHSPFGGGIFLKPDDPGKPFVVNKGLLTIRAEKTGGKWRSGLMQTVDSKGSGFAQQYGYFEMTAKFPPGKGAWPAFWLLSQNGFLDKTATRGEIDVIEWYGGDPKGHHASVHLWPANQPAENGLTKHVGRSHYYKLTPILTSGQLEGFHSYGAEITPEWVITYFDRREVARFRTLPEYKTPLYMVVDLAIFKDEADVATSPKEMVVDSVTAYIRK